MFALQLKGEHWNLPLLCTTEAVLHWNMVTGKFNSQRCQQFFHQATFALSGSEVEYVQMDNASMHDDGVVVSAVAVYLLRVGSPEMLQAGMAQQPDVRQAMCP